MGVGVQWDGGRMKDISKDDFKVGREKGRGGESIEEEVSFALEVFLGGPENEAIILSLLALRHVERDPAAVRKGEKKIPTPRHPYGRSSHVEGRSRRSLRTSSWPAFPHASGIRVVSQKIEEEKEAPLRRRIRSIFHPDGKCVCLARD